MTHRPSIRNPGRLTVLAALLAGLSAPAFADGIVVISQVYGGGGNTGATHKNDFIELFNRGDAAVNLKNWSVQYASTGGSSWTVTKIATDLVIQPGQYILIQEGAGNGAGEALPTPDLATGTGTGNTTLSMSGMYGKVALVSNQANLTTTSPTAAGIVDFVGYGPTSGSNTVVGFEGSGPAPQLANGTSAMRKSSCVDTNDNAADFSSGTPVPRNSQSPVQACTPGTPGTPAAKPIVPTCPSQLTGAAGTAFAGALSATDGDSIVNSAIISSASVAGISLSGFSPAGAAGGKASATLSAAASTVAGNYPVVITFGNNDGQSASCTVNVSMTGLVRTIPQLQGSGPASPYAGTVQTTTGVITKKLSAGGFFIQDPNGDGDPTTSDGLYVYEATTPASVGDLVRVTGTVTEYRQANATRTVTELTNVTTITPLGAGPSIVPANVRLGDYDLSRYEGMLVRFSGALTVNGNQFIGDRGELVLGSTRHETPTNRYRPNSPEARALALENERDMVILDDGIFTTPSQIPYLDQGTRRAGDTISELTGVLDFGAIGGSAAWYKLQPTETPLFTGSNARVAAPAVASGNVRVASANVLNFFTTFTNGTDAEGHIGVGCKVGSTTSAGNCRGADNKAEFTRQLAKIVNELKGMDADAVGLMEIENNGVDRDRAVRYLVDALNAAIGSNAYAYVANAPATGTDAIRVAMIYKPARLTPVGAPMTDNDPVNNRPPLAQTFKVNANGAKFSLIVNHLKSKGGCGSASGDDRDSGDGQGCFNASRVDQAKRLATYFIPAVQAASGDMDVLAVGDFNSYGHEDPIAYLTETAGMVNQLERFVRPGGIPYSYVFDAQAGYLDHALSTSSLSPQVAGVTEWHNNADEPEVIDYNIDSKNKPDDEYVDNAFRASDHDPVVVSLNLAPAYVDVSGSVTVAKSGLAVNRSTGKYTGTVSFTNTSGAVINGPLQFRLDGLSAGVTLDNASGTQGGVPYVTLSQGSIAPGATVTVPVTFSNPSKALIGYTAKLFTGTF